MKKSCFIFLFILGLTATGFAQSTPPVDFFAGKWLITILGTPNGDSKLETNLVRKEGKLTGELADPNDAKKPKIPITKVEETATKLTIYFESSQAGELAINLDKVDDDTLKGNVFSFDANAKRLK